MTLSVYNLLGEVVGRLLDGVTLAAGPHRATWNGGNFPSGIYFYRLTTPARSETRPMMLVR